MPALGSGHEHAGSSATLALKSSSKCSDRPIKSTAGLPSAVKRQELCGSTCSNTNPNLSLQQSGLQSTQAGQAVRMAALGWSRCASRDALIGRAGGRAVPASPEPNEQRGGWPKVVNAKMQRTRAWATSQRQLTCPGIAQPLRWVPEQRRQMISGTAAESRACG